jgi:hypothetical protein
MCFRVYGILKVGSPWSIVWCSILQALALSHSLSPSLTHKHSLPLSLSFTHSFSQAHTCTLSLTLSLSLTHTLSLSHSLAHSLSDTHTHTQPPFFSPGYLVVFRIQEERVSSLFIQHLQTRVFCCVGLSRVWSLFRI